jgi:magnesium-transporting ATPase (P-type)
MKTILALFTLSLLFKIIKISAIVIAVFFVATFSIYWFNIENKLIYYVVRPFLNKHYDAMKRDRKI